MCQLKLTGRSSGIQQTPSASPKKTRKVLCLSPIFLVYGWGPWGTCGTEGVERIRAWEGPFQEQGCPLARIQKELSFPFWESLLFICVFVVVVQLLSRVLLSETPWTVVHQAPLSMGFSWQEYWSGCHFLLQFVPLKVCKYMSYCTGPTRKCAVTIMMRAPVSSRPGRSEWWRPQTCPPSAWEAVAELWKPHSSCQNSRVGSQPADDTRIHFWGFHGHSIPKDCIKWWEDQSLSDYPPIILIK